MAKESIYGKAKGFLSSKTKGIKKFYNEGKTIYGEVKADYKKAKPKIVKAMKKSDRLGRRLSNSVIGDDERRLTGGNLMGDGDILGTKPKKSNGKKKRPENLYQMFV